MKCCEYDTSRSVPNYKQKINIFPEIDIKFIHYLQFLCISEMPLKKDSPSPPNINKWIEQAAESGINDKILSDFEMIGPHSILFAYAEWNCLDRLLV
jgi:hypothetical protein